MDKVIQIYDMLSDGIENNAQVMRIAYEKEGMKQEEKREN